MESIGDNAIRNLKESGYAISSTTFGIEVGNEFCNHIGLVTYENQFDNAIIVFPMVEEPWWKSKRNGRITH